MQCTQRLVNALHRPLHIGTDITPSIDTVTVGRNRTAVNARGAPHVRESECVERDLCERRQRKAGPNCAGRGKPVLRHVGQQTCYLGSTTVTLIALPPRLGMAMVMVPNCLYFCLCFEQGMIFDQPSSLKREAWSLDVSHTGAQGLSVVIPSVRDCCGAGREACDELCAA